MQEDEASRSSNAVKVQQHPELQTRPCCTQVLSMARRTCQLENTGLELFFPGRSSLYLTLKTPHAREDLRSCLQAQPGLRMRHQRSQAMWRRDWCLGKVPSPPSLNAAPVFAALPVTVLL